VTALSWLWIIWGAAFLGIEFAAILRKERPDQPATLTDNVEWLISGVGRWHVIARTVLAMVLAWLPGHFGLS
jgi:hypothetical protein